MHSRKSHEPGRAPGHESICSAAAKPAGEAASDSAAVLAWAKRWHALGKLSFGSEYNDALQGVTELFAGKNAAPERPSGSALNQLRTNEVALANLASDLSNLLRDLRQLTEKAGIERITFHKLRHTEIGRAHV